jgi:fatty acid/phospholipid biosynthesis enzyme
LLAALSWRCANTHRSINFSSSATPAQIEAELKKVNCNDRRIQIVHSTQVVAMTDGAVDSVRRKKDSSVSWAVDLVKGEAAAIVSSRSHRRSGAAATIKCATLPGIDRPGIAAVIPSETNIFVLIDAERTATRNRNTCSNTASWAQFIRARFSATESFNRFDVDRRRGRERD